jgi:hypothetical protein
MGIRCLGPDSGRFPTSSSEAIEQHHEGNREDIILAFFSSIGTIQFEKAKVYYDC